MAWAKVRHKEEHRVKYWIRPVSGTASSASMWEIRSTKLAFHDKAERPPERCLPGGTFSDKAIKMFYEPVYD